MIDGTKIYKKISPHPLLLCLLVVLELHLLQVLRLARDVHVVGASLNAGGHNLRIEILRYLQIILNL